MQVCAASRELRFFVNGVDQGVAFRDLPLGTPLSGAVSLYNKDSQIAYNVRNSVGLAFAGVCMSSCAHSRAFSGVYRRV